MHCIQDTRLFLMRFSILVLTLPTLVATQQAETPTSSSSDPCMTSPWDPSCAKFTYSPQSATLDIQSICQTDSYLVGCSIKNVCESTSSAAQALRAKGYCQPFSILASVCSDASTSAGCRNFNSMCLPLNSTIAECHTVPRIPSLPSTFIVNKSVRTMCKIHRMDGCEKCSFKSDTSYANCDLFSVYSQLCVGMPSMSSCNALKQTCSQTPELKGYCPPTADAALNSSMDDDSSMMAPVMKMYFHNEPAYLIFKKWVPRTNGDYVWTIVILIFFSLMIEAIRYHRPTLEAKLPRPRFETTNAASGASGLHAKFGSSSTVASNQETTPIASSIGPTRNYTTCILNSRRLIVLYLLLMVLRGIESVLSFFLMLAAMTFNVRVFVGVILSVVIGYIVFLPLHLKRNNVKTFHESCH